jgi:hypothetical protein
MNRSFPNPKPASMHATTRTRLADIGSVALVCGPATAPGQFEDLRAMGEGWKAALHAWEHSGAAYCLLVARHDDVEHGETFARPITFCTHDAGLLEQAIWSVVAQPGARPFVLDCLEPSMDRFVSTVRQACRLEPGHA